MPLDGTITIQSQNQRIITLLHNAEQLLLTHGWTKGVCYKKGRHCLVGALLHFTPLYDGIGVKDCGLAMGLIWETLLRSKQQCLAHSCTDSLTIWNDSQESKEPVIALLRATRLSFLAEVEEEQGQ